MFTTKHQLLKRVETLEKDVKRLKGKKPKIVSGVKAREIIRKTLKEMNEAGKEWVTSIDIHFKTRLPIGQISEIMAQLET